MTSDTFPPMPACSPRRAPPIDIVLHSLQDALTGLIKESAEKSPALISIAEMNASTLACALTRAINPGALAQHWADDGDADIAGAHLARRLTPTTAGPTADPRPTSNAEGRALETAVARRLADTACSLSITGDKEDAAQASALWEAAATLTGLLPPYTGDTLRAAALQALMQADERDSMVREHLGAGDTETTVDAAKRVAKERDDFRRRDPCSTCREDRRKAVSELEETNRQHAIAINAAEQAVAMAHNERDEAVADLKGAGRVLEKVRAALGWSTGDGMLSEFAADIAARLKTATALASQRLDAITAMDKQVAGWGEKYQQACRERDEARELVRMSRPMQDNTTGDTQARAIEARSRAAQARHLGDWAEEIAQRLETLAR